jgi:hypothetical protein
MRAAQGGYPVIPRSAALSQQLGGHHCPAWGAGSQASSAYPATCRHACVVPRSPDDYFLPLPQIPLSIISTFSLPPCSCFSEKMKKPCASPQLPATQPWSPHLHLCLPSCRSRSWLHHCPRPKPACEHSIKNMAPDTHPVSSC